MDMGSIGANTNGLDEYDEQELHEQDSDEKRFNRMQAEQRRSRKPTTMEDVHRLERLATRIHDGRDRASVRASIDEALRYASTDAIKERLQRLLDDLDKE